MQRPSKGRVDHARLVGHVKTPFADEIAKHRPPFKRPVQVRGSITPKIEKKRMSTTDFSRPNQRLSRHESYEPHRSSPSTSTSIPVSADLSLGSLPAPQFGTLPAGQRSVPAVEQHRFPTQSHLKASASTSMQSADGQRTPGGSLVIGAEVFGFGSSAAKAGSALKDAWAPPDTNGSSTSNDPWSTSLTSLQVSLLRLT